MGERKRKERKRKEIHIPFHSDNFHLGRKPAFTQIPGLVPLLEQKAFLEASGNLGGGILSKKLLLGNQEVPSGTALATLTILEIQGRRASFE